MKNLYILWVICVLIWISVAFILQKQTTSTAPTSPVVVEEWEELAQSWSENTQEVNIEVNKPESPKEYSENFKWYKPDTIEYDVYNSCVAFMEKGGDVETYLADEWVVFSNELSSKKITDLQWDEQGLFFINKLKNNQWDYDTFKKEVEWSELQYFEGDEGWARKYVLYYGGIVSGQIKDVATCQSFITDNLFEGLE